MIRGLLKGAVNLTLGSICFAFLPAAVGVEYVRGDRTLRSASRVTWLVWLWTFTTTPGTEREKRIWKALSEAEARRK